MLKLVLFGPTKAADILAKNAGCGMGLNTMVGNFMNYKSMRNCRMAVDITRLNKGDIVEKHIT